MSVSHFPDGHIFAGLPVGTAGALLVDLPWHFKRYSEKASALSAGRAPQDHYDTMSFEEMKDLPIGQLCLPDSVGIFWTTAPHLEQMMALLPIYGFTYKTIGFGWMKADVSTIDLFPDPKDADIKMGYWTRSNLEIALLATKGKPKRKDAGVRMGIIEPAREHSRKPDCVHDRIERLVDGPYVELFARTRRKNWLTWGNDLGMFTHAPRETAKPPTADSDQL